MKSFIKKLLIQALILLSFLNPVFAESLTLFTIEIEAQNHCPYDEIVWLNIPTHIWHPKGGRWYGTTKNGAYVCKNEARFAGNRGSLNGQ